MPKIDESRPFIRVRIALLTMSDTRSLADGIEAVLAHADIRRRLVEAGLANVTRFSWDAAAAQARAVLEAVGGRG